MGSDIIEIVELVQDAHNHYRFKVEEVMACSPEKDLVMEAFEIVAGGLAVLRQVALGHIDPHVWLEYVRDDFVI